jgi:hypothetical protein
LLQQASFAFIHALYSVSAKESYFKERKITAVAGTEAANKFCA